MVYVGRRRYRMGRMIMSHMIADSLDELHEMAKRIGVDQKHFQDKRGQPHYDICISKKELAMSFDAKLIDDREMIAILRNNYSQNK